MFGSASITVGDYHRIQTQGMINIPLSDDIALRIAAIQDRRDGYVDFRKGSNVAPGTRKYGAGDQKGARASLLWRFMPDLKATFIADYYSDTGAGNIYLAAEPAPGRDLRSALIDTPGALDQSIITGKAKVQWRPLDGIETQYLGSWSRLKRTNASDADAGFYPPAGIPTATTRPTWRTARRRGWAAWNTRSRRTS